MATNRSRSLPPLALAVLNLLVERPMHPYELQRLMRERGHDRVLKLKGASVYDTIERLQRLGLTEALETTRDGRRPERTVYRITPSGRAEVREWLRDELSVPASEYPRFAAALAFVGGLVMGDHLTPMELTAEALEAARDEAVSLLGQRTVRLEAEIAASDAILTVSREEFRVPRLFVIEEEYARAMRRAELEWVRQLIRDVQEGDLWPSLENLMALAPAAAEAGQGEMTQ
jgi:DNA-binding PadR family transcriptional regulator